MEAYKYRPNDPRETPGGTTKTPGLPWRIAACSIPPVLPHYKWQEIRELHNESTVASGHRNCDIASPTAFLVEVEDFLHVLPGVKDVAAIGLPEERLGEVVGVIVEVIPGKSLTEEEVLKYCEPLPKYKRPRKIFFGEVPRNPTGKIEKPKLRKKYIGMEEAFKIK